MGFVLAWTTLRLFVWGLIAVWVHPRLLDALGGHGLAIWLERHLWVRLLAVPVLGVLGILSAFDVMQTSGRRARREATARAMGGTAVAPPRMDPVYGLPDGPELKIPIGRWTMSVVRMMRGSARTTIARVEWNGTPGFRFMARDARGAPKALRGLEQWAFRLAMNRMARPAGDPRAAAARSLAFLAEPPVPIGHDRLDRSAVLRSNRPEWARALLTSNSVAAAVEALNAASYRWTWTLQAAGDAAGAEMRIECSRSADDIELLHRLEELMRAALEHLSEHGMLAA